MTPEKMEQLRDLVKRGDELSRSIRTATECLSGLRDSKSIAFVFFGDTLRILRAEDSAAAAEGEEMKSLELSPADPRFVQYAESLQEEKISQRTFESLPEYSCSVPTGVVPGKVWKCNLSYYSHIEPVWIIREYVVSGADHCRIEDRRPVLT